MKNNAVCLQRNKCVTRSGSQEAKNEPTKKQNKKTLNPNICLGMSMLGRKNKASICCGCRAPHVMICALIGLIGKQDPGRDSMTLVPNDFLDCQKFGFEFQTLLSSLLSELLQTIRW